MVLNKLPIVFLGNPALRRVSKPVVNVRSPAIQQLLDNMKEAVRKEDGVGIAAPQLGQNERMFLMMKNAPAHDDDLDSFEMEYQECINPTIVAASKQTAKDFEGCLSIPGYMGVVRRAKEVTVAFTDAQGDQHEQTLRGFPARIFQHELDHLDGVLYLDRAEKDTFIHEDEFRNLSRQDLHKLLKD